MKTFISTNPLRISCGVIVSNKYLDQKGYWRYKDSDRLVHRVVSKPARGEVVHHNDGNPRNFRKKNLQNMSRSEHSKLHAKKRKKGLW
jgi:hypothetical protein